jgi:2-dehydro-3-deoxyphosphogluconate aldolase/(4S)-4-hydroxy-2-oxoglutarate aldolase
MMLKQLQEKDKIIPVVITDNPDQALAMSEALLNGGISVTEITLRTPAAIESIAAVKNTYPEMTVLAGTVMDVDSLKAVVDAGVDGAISPAFSAKLIHEAEKLNIPYLPAVATPSEVLAGIELGLSEFKLFPAAVVGGVSMLKALASPMPQATFCPTGGLTLDNFMDYLSLPNVACVGGSWMMDKTAIAEKDWGKITSIVKESLSRLN